VAPKVSLCMIVRDEAHHLPDCLATAGDLVDEIIVVDTGSTDATAEFARRAGARVHSFAWNDDFSAARNESIRHATGDWIFWLDADDRIDGPNRHKLRDLFASLSDDNVAYVMVYLALREMGMDKSSIAHHVKLFRNDPRIRWRYRVHEQILPAIEEAGGRPVSTDIVIHHLGYQDPETVRRKLERNLRLLRLEDVDHPGDPLTLFNLGRTVMRLGQLKESLPYLRQAIDKLHPSAAFMTRTAYALSIEALCRLKRSQQAIEICREGRARFPLDPELLLAEGLVLRDLGDRASAVASLERLLELDPQNAAARFHLGYLRPTGTFQITI
jgi:Glycosyl transferase family 2/Tetratricopeptide repeat